MGFRSTYPVEINTASERAFDLISREKEGPLLETENAELVTLLSGTAGKLFKHESFEPNWGTSYDDSVVLSPQVRGTEGLRISVAWTAEGHNAHIYQIQELTVAVEERTQAAHSAAELALAHRSVGITVVRT